MHWNASRRLSWQSCTNDHDVMVSCWVNYCCCCRWLLGQGWQSWRPATSASTTHVKLKLEVVWVVIPMWHRLCQKNTWKCAVKCATGKAIWNISVRHHCLILNIDHDPKAFSIWHIACLCCYASSSTFSTGNLAEAATGSPTVWKQWGQ